MPSTIVSPEMLKVIAGSLITSLVAISLFFLGRIFESRRDLNNARRTKETDMLLTMLEKLLAIQDTIETHLIELEQVQTNKAQYESIDPSSAHFDNAIYLANERKKLGETLKDSLEELNVSNAKMAEIQTTYFLMLSHSEMLGLSSFMDYLSRLIGVCDEVNKDLKNISTLDINDLKTKTFDYTIACTDIIHAEYQKRWGKPKKPWYRFLVRKQKKG